jgi:hypothetical protein
VERHNSNSMPVAGREDRIREIDRRVAELDALLDSFVIIPAAEKTRVS